MSDYFKVQALSASGAKLLLPPNSPAAFKHWQDNPKPDAPALSFGRLLHALVLEPNEVDARYAVAPKVDRRTKEGKATWDAFCAEAGSREVIAADDFDKAQAMAQALSGNRRWQALFAGAVEVRRECEVYWTDKATCCPCKAKLDALVVREGSASVVDVKTTTAHLTGGGLSKALADWAYHRQGAGYVDAAGQLGHDGADFWLAFVSKDAPHDVAVVRVTDDALAHGWREMAVARRVYVACQSAGVWPGAQDLQWDEDGRAVVACPTEIGLPGWYRGLGSEVA